MTGILIGVASSLRRGRRSIVRIGRRIGRSTAGILAIWAVVALIPRAVRACAVCTAGRDDETNQAFLLSTIFLSLLPLAALGTLIFVLWRRIRALEAGPTGGAPPTRDASEARPATPNALTPPSPAR